MPDLQTWVGQVAGLMADNGSDLEYPGSYALVTEYGQVFTPPASIDDNEARMVEYGVDPGDLKDCHVNSGQAVVFDDTPSLFYTEGIAYGAAGVPVDHAWLVTAAGQVVDPTWGQHDAQLTESYRLDSDEPSDVSPGTEYFGIPFAHEAVQESAMDNGVWGMIGHWNRSYYEDGIPAANLADVSTDLTTVARSDTL